MQHLRSNNFQTDDDVINYNYETNLDWNLKYQCVDNPDEVLVNDAAGKPVPGVTIQFCSDTECIMGTTNDKGIAAFDKEAGSYTIHVLKVPEGYAPDDTEYSAPAKPGLVTIVLK